MLRSWMVATTLAIAVAFGPALAQDVDQNPPAQLERTLVGLRVYSSDGQNLGQVTKADVPGQAGAIVVEMGQFLGIGSTNVLITPDAFERASDRIQLAMTSDEVRDRLSRNQAPANEGQTQ